MIIYKRLSIKWDEIHNFKTTSLVGYLDLKSAHFVNRWTLNEDLGSEKF